MFGVNAWMSVATAQVAEAARKMYSVPGGNLEDSLNTFARQAGVTLSFDPVMVRGKTSMPLQGSYSVEQGFARLLQGSGLESVRSGASIILRRTVSVAGEQQMAEVKVVAAGDGNVLPVPYAGGQVATGGRLGLLGNRDVMDIPFNQTNFTAKKAQDQQAATVRDVLIDDPSVRYTYPDGSAADDTIYIRGFPVFAANFSYGGLYGMLPTFSIMAELAERIEILKGPSAMLNGMSPLGAVGGTVNIVPKRAPEEPITQFTAGYSSKSQVGGHLDVARRFGSEKQFGVRYNGVIRSGDTPVDRNADRRDLQVLGLDFRDSRVRLSADLGYQYQYIDGALPYLGVSAGVPLPAVPDPSKSYDQSWNFSKRKDVFGVVRGEIDLTDQVTAYAAYGLHDFHQSALAGSARLSVTNINGNATASPYSQNVDQEYETAEIGLRARFDTGSISHELAIAAMTFDRENRLGTNNGTPFATNIFNPNLVVRANIADPVARKVATAGLSSLAVVDTLSILDKRVQLTLGARLQQVKAASFNAVTGAQTSSYDEDALSPSVAIVVKPWQRVSIYGNWIQGLQQGATVGLAFANAGQIFAPYKSTQYEAGVKVDWGKFTTTASLFQITLPSVITNVPTNTQVLDGEQRNRGLELNTFGELAPGIRLLGGVMFLDPVLTKTQGGLTNGWIAPMSPEVQLNLGGEWDLPSAPGLTLNARIVHTGSQYVDTTSPRRTLPDWTRFDLGVRYAISSARGPAGRPIILRFNIDNVFDRNYWAGGGGATSLLLGAPRTFRLSMTTDF